MRDNLDRFYTPHSTAQQCVDVIDNLNDYDHILEPSAGSGSFSTLLDNCFAYDIAPQHKDIITQDFLQLQNLPQHKSSLVIGNPPHLVLGRNWQRNLYHIALIWVQILSPLFCHEHLLNTLIKQCFLMSGG